MIFGLRYASSFPWSWVIWSHPLPTTRRRFHHQRGRGRGHHRRLRRLQHPGHHRPERHLCRAGESKRQPAHVSSPWEDWTHTSPLLSPQTITLTWWSLFRDSSYYILSVLALIMVSSLILNKAVKSLFLCVPAWWFYLFLGYLWCHSCLVSSLCWKKPVFTSWNIFDGRGRFRCHQLGWLNVSSVF